MAKKAGTSARKPAASKKMPTTYEELLRMAKQYGVDQNALFLAAAKQYDLQQRVIAMLNAGIEDGELTTSKTYIAGQSNDYAAPLVKELPKHSDAANRTAQVILDRELTGDILHERVEHLLLNDRELQQMKLAAGRAGRPEAAMEIAKQATALINKRET